ncbi:MAG: hypothetical protein ACR5KW_01620 [Wolbachia sp.]
MDILDIIFCYFVASRQYELSDTFDDQENNDKNELSEKSLNIIKYITSKLVL